MNYNIYLLWVPNEGWGVFGYGCPDTGAFPTYMYRQYTIPEKQYDKVFSKLMDIQGKLNSEGTIPTKANEKNIFPDISTLLSD